MKKFTFLLLITIASSVAFAQSQRLVLMEYFTQASCGPCATYNPNINALLAANPNLVVALKYQTSWPGYDPMNLHNPTEIQNRVSYYGVSGVPAGVIDGNYYQGHPNGINQTSLNTRGAVTSPFTIVLNHTLSPALDAINITGTITATGALSGSYVVRVAVIEKQISFNTAPGTNGEKVFHSVMKKMLPTPNGEALPATINVNDQFTISQSWQLANIYDLNQVAVVAFIQNTANKEVMQAGYSGPQQLAIDAGVSAVTAVPLFTCANTITPTVTIKNFGASDVTSLDINYAVNGGAVSTQPWAGTLASGATANVTLPSITVPAAASNASNVSIYVSGTNGIGELNHANDTARKSFDYITNYAMAPVAEGFVGVQFPPADWMLNNPDGGATWSRKTAAGGFGASSTCSKMDFYNSTSGNVDELYIKPLNLSTVSGPLSLVFNMAYCQYQAENDRLEVQVSTNCGASWNTAFTKQGAAMSTAPAQTASFTPNATQWRGEMVDLTTYLGQTEVLIRFKATSAYGNNMYIDDINVANVTGVNDLANTAVNFNIYPVPVTEKATISFELKEKSKVEIAMINNLGETVIVNSLGNVSAGKHAHSMNVSELPAGIYFMTLTTGNQSVTRKIAVAR